MTIGIFIFLIFNSVHNSTIFGNFMMRAQFENYEVGNCLLLGDGRFPSFLSLILILRQKINIRYNLDTEIS